MKIGPAASTLTATVLLSVQPLNICHPHVMNQELH